MPETTEAHDIITTAQEAVEPHQLTDGIWLARQGDGSYDTIDLTDDIEQAQPHPNRKTGTFKITDVPSFAAYLNKHGIDATELWGNRDAGTIRAVINAHDGDSPDGEGPEFSDDGQPGNPGWGDHTATLTLTHTDDWKEWNTASGKWLSKDQFAEFIEDHLPNFGKPSGAEMLELARSFRATVNVEFGNTEHAGGKTTVAYTKTTEAKAGQKGAVAFPDQVQLGMYVYEGGNAYPVTARIRYRVTDGSLALSFKLDRPKDVLQIAFQDVVNDVEAATQRVVWATS